MMTTGRPGPGVARKLGWFSIALGVAEMAMPHRVAQWAGIRGREPAVLAFGVREVVTGIGLLTTSRPAPWLWARTAGDLLDLATLAGSPGPMTSRRATALLSVGAVTALDAWCATSLTEESPRRPRVSYHDRSGFARGVEQMRGAALANFTPPADMRIPEALRPLNQPAQAPAPRLALADAH